jgi:hypothetical protein
MTGEVFCPYVKATNRTPYALAQSFQHDVNLSILEIVSLPFLLFEGFPRVEPLNLPKARYSLKDPQAKNIAAAFDMGCLIVHIFSGGSRVFSY